MRQLVDDGDPLRAAMEEAGMSIQDLADKTRTIDGYGISRALIGHLVSTGRSSRDRCADRSAALIARALGKDEEQLFVPLGLSCPAFPQSREDCPQSQEG